MPRPIPALSILLLALAPGCRTVTAADGTEIVQGAPALLSLEVGTTTTLHGDVLKGAETSAPSVTLTSVQSIAGRWAWQVQLAGMSVVEKEDDASYGGRTGDFRQDTGSYGLLLGPRYSGRPLGGDGGGPGADLEVFGDAGFGVHWTQIVGRYPRGGGDSKYMQWTWNLGASLGAGAVYDLSESFFLGLAFRYHLVFLRINRGENYFHADNAADEAVTAAIRDDSGGGRTDDLGFLTAGLTLGLRW